MEAIQIVLLGGGCAAVVAIPRFQTIQWKHFRTAMFVAVGLSGVLPMSHAVRLFGIPQANLQMGWSYFVMEAVCYISGAIFYAVRPKYLKPCGGGNTDPPGTDQAARAVVARTIRCVGKLTSILPRSCRPGGLGSFCWDHNGFPL